MAVVQYLDYLDWHLEGAVVAVAAVDDEGGHDDPFVVVVNDADLIDEFADAFASTLTIFHHQHSKGTVMLTTADGRCHYMIGFSIDR